MATSRNVSGRVVGSQDGSEVAAPQGDQLVLAVGTERGASAFALPSQRQIATHALPESSSVVVAKAVEWGKDKCSPLLLSFTSDGKVKALSLPTLRTLTESPLIMNINPASTASTRIFKTISFSAGGAGLFFTNQNQVLLPKPKSGTFAKTRYFCQNQNQVLLPSFLPSSASIAGSKVLREQREHEGSVRIFWGILPGSSSLLLPT